MKYLARHNSIIRLLGNCIVRDWPKARECAISIVAGSQQCCRECALLQGVCNVAGSVHCCRECAMLQGVCNVAGSVQCCRECALLQGVCNVAGSVQCCRECAMLQGVCIVAGSVQCCRECAADNRQHVSGVTEPPQGTIPQICGSTTLTS